MVCEFVESYRVMEYRSDEWGQNIDARTKQKNKEHSVGGQLRYAQQNADDTMHL